MPRRGPRQPQHQVGDPSDPHGFAVRLADYLEWLQTRNFSEHTVTVRDLHLKQFIDWCEARGLARPTEVTKPILERYQRHLFYQRKQNGRPLTVRTQNGRLSSLRIFFRWLTRHNYLLSNPASELELPRVEKRLPQVLTVAEVERVLAQADLSDPLGVRDRAIMEVLYSTGMRRMEVAGLQVTDLDEERGTVVIRQGKGKKDRTVPVGERAAAWVQKYRLETRPQLLVPPDDGTLFLTYLGEAIAPNTLTKTIRDYVDAAELGKHGSCHLFRHTMATAMLEGGADIRFIQQMLGHAKLETTQLYTQVSIRKLKEIHTATHPGAKLGRRQRPSDDGEAEPTEQDLLAELAGEEAEELWPQQQDAGDGGDAAPLDPWPPACPGLI